MSHRGVCDIIHAAIQPKHSAEQVFIPHAVGFPSRCVVSIKTLSNLLCKFNMGLQLKLGLQF